MRKWENEREKERNREVKRRDGKREKEVK
jgi:hypothetical protein